ncbi:MAG: protein TonB [Hyphomicrobiaceae bacterium]|jgi:protein TonB
MAGRYPSAMLLAALVTFGLFFTMQYLIAGRAAPLGDSVRVRGLEFVRLSRSEEVKRKERAKPKKIEQKEPPPSAPAIAKGPGPMVQNLVVDMPDFTPSLAFGEGGEGGGGASAGNQDLVPLVRVNPQYPARARARGVEGWVHLRFTVTSEGATTDITVVDAEPHGYFERAAAAAVERYKYKPRIEGGSAVAQKAVELVLAFELER